jgi:hypothetical protein
LASQEKNSFGQLPSRKFLGLGGHKAHRIAFPDYCLVVQTALEQGINVLESTSISNYSAFNMDEGGDALLAKAYRRALENSSHDLSTKPVVVTLRLGYRTVTISNDTPKDTPGYAVDQKQPQLLLPGDLLLEEDYPLGMNQEQPDSPVPLLHRVFHNLSSDYLEHALLSSPLFQLAQENPNVTLLPLIHNPEAQQQSERHVANDNFGNDNLVTKLTRAFVLMEQVRRRHPDKMLGFGVVSHGLTLPASHPMYLDWKKVLFPAAKAAALELASGGTPNGKNDISSSLSVIQLAANVLEPRGIEVARAVQDYCRSFDLPVQIWAMRPFTCYPDSNSNSSSVTYPRKLVDLPLPTIAITDTMSSLQSILSEPTNNSTEGLTPASTANIQTTHTMSSSSPPLIYQRALAKTMAHFDATDLLERTQNGESLTAAERETLDGCKLLQSMLHDLDSFVTNTIQVDSLQTLQKCFTSWEEYQDYLYKQVIPLLRDTFEEYDDESGTVLQEFFAAYGIAVRHALCHQTRNIISRYSADKSGVTLEPTMSMQEFGLGYLLESNSGISGIIMGCSQSEQVLENMHIYKQFMERTTEPH